MVQDTIIYFGDMKLEKKDLNVLFFKEKNGHRRLVHKTWFFLILVVLMISNVGCNKWLDIKPESEMVLEDYWQTESQATAVLAGCYKSLTSDACMSRIVLWGEGRSDNVSTLNNSDEDLRKMVTFDLKPANVYCKWGAFYTVINNCNTFLYYAPGVLKVDKNFTQSKLDALTSEALTIRSLAYFYLVRAFRRVPWIDQPSINDKQNFYIPQSSDTFVIAKIIKDLNTALQYAPASYGSAQYDKGRVTKNAIRALLADVYLWNNQYSDCVLQCNQIIEDQNLQLVDSKSTLQDVFSTGNSSESIFELQFGLSQNNQQFNNIVHNYYGSIDNVGQLSFSSFLYSGTLSPFNYQMGATKESSDDSRYKDFVLPVGDKYLIFKYTGYQRVAVSSTLSTYVYRNSSVPSNWILYRLADVILMKAEALVQMDRSDADLQEAIQMLNITYLRSNTSSGTDSLRFETYQNKSNLASLVLRERQRELLFEGKRWFDLMRFARRAGNPGPLINFVAQKFSGSNSTQVGSKSIMDALYLPVNEDDLKANPKLTQNPYYDLTDVTSN